MDKTQDMLNHLRELRSRMIYVAVAFGLLTLLCYSFAESIYQFLAKPLYAAMQNSDTRRLIFTGLTEPFFTYVKLAVFMAFILCFPLLSWQLYRFCAPGMYHKEQHAFRPYIYGAPTLFLLGASLAYFFIIPLAWRFFIGFEIAPGTENMAMILEPRVSEYLSLTMRLIIAFGMAFQLPLILLLLHKSGIVSDATLRRNRRYVFLGILVISAIITPPDIISQIGLSLPLYCLYELTLYATRYQETQKILDDLEAEEEEANHSLIKKEEESEDA